MRGTYLAEHGRDDITIFTQGSATAATTLRAHPEAGSKGPDHDHATLRFVKKQYMFVKNSPSVKLRLRRVDCTCSPCLGLPGVEVDPKCGSRAVSGCRGQSTWRGCAWGAAFLIVVCGVNREDLEDWPSSLDEPEHLSPEGREGGEGWWGGAVPESRRLDSRTDWIGWHVWYTLCLWSGAGRLVFPVAGRNTQPRSAPAVQTNGGIMAVAYIMRKTLGGMSMHASRPPLEAMKIRFLVPTMVTEATQNLR